MKSAAAPTQIQPELFGMPNRGIAAQALKGIRLEPNRTVYPVPYQEPGQVMVADLVPLGGSDFRLVARLHDRWVKLTTESIRRLGLGVSYKTLRRLMAAGFVRGTTVAPRTHMMDLQSYYEHVERCAADPEFWDKGDRHKRFRDAHASL